MRLVRSPARGENAVTSRTQQVLDDYLATFRTIVDDIDLAGVLRAVELLRKARDRGATIYIAGNGGSATTATHLANDLGKATKQSGQRPLKVLSLSDNVAWLTALANDEGYDRVFAGQLENFAEEGDLLIVISASGRSANLVAAVDLALQRGVDTLGILGFDGGVLKDRVDECLWVKSRIGAYGPVETGHALLCDLLTTSLINDVPGDSQDDGE